MIMNMKHLVFIIIACLLPCMAFAQYYDHRTRGMDTLELILATNPPTGLDLCPEIRKRYPDVKILMLTSYAETNVVVRALDKGAHGYMLKNSTSEEVIEGIQTVSEGK